MHTIHDYIISVALGLHVYCNVSDQSTPSRQLCSLEEGDDGDNEVVGEFERPSAEGLGVVP